MSDVFIQAPEAQLMQLYSDAKELAEDVILEAEERYSERGEYPTLQRRYDRDTETARRVLDILAKESKWSQD